MYLGGNRRWVPLRNVKRKNNFARAARVCYPRIQPQGFTYSAFNISASCIKRDKVLKNAN